MSNIISNTVSTIKNWWLFLLAGFALIAGGVYVTQTPEDSYVALAWIFSVLVLLNGAANIYFSYSNRLFIKGWGWYLAGGIFELVFGILLLQHPDISMAILPLFVGFWLMFRGIQIIGTALDFKSLGVLNWGWIMLLGIVITALASLMIVFPLFAVFNIIYLTALSLILLGIANIFIGFQLKKIKANTIDKVQEFKKDLKKDINSNLNNLKDEIFKAYDSASDEDKSKIDNAFKAYEDSMKS